MPCLILPPSRNLAVLYGQTPLKSLYLGAIKSEMEKISS
uniref:Uncharacterized protein n=1 Tax=Myoviridae sp. ctuYn2 TaxID=2823533 RepID=A0A8S5L8U6_9CAUD|nr:MAG TPA: hypothetical protein [Myoviridae sp. ctuYn2]